MAAITGQEKYDSDFDLENGQGDCKKGNDSIYIVKEKSTSLKEEREGKRDLKDDF